MRLLVLDLREFADLLAIAPHIETAVERIARSREVAGDRWPSLSDANASDLRSATRSPVRGE
jgi:hypothetical protein